MATLLERDPSLAHLAACLEDAVGGHGHLVFLSGEAGGGKTSVVEHFAARARRQAQVALCSCDGVGIGGPFGALLDVAGALGPQVEAVLSAQASRERIFSTVLASLHAAPGPNVVVGEDAHWSDEASLDLVRFLGRRIGSTHTLLIVTYRDDALGPAHPLRRVLGDLVTAPAVSRLALPPLSPTAVRTLAAGSGLDPAALYDRTGGNPFFVTEIVAAGGTDVPASIRDAVLARVAVLSAERRAVLEAAAAMGLVVEAEVLAAVVAGPIADAVEDGLAAGLLRQAGDEVLFRHALTREVVLGAMAVPRRTELHRRILRVLEADPASAGDLPRLAHHAAAGRVRDAVLHYAPAAAREAAAYGAHREAAAQFGRALQFAHGVPAGEVADLLEARSAECALTGQLEEAIADRTRAVAVRQALGEPLKVGDNLRWLSRLCGLAGRNDEAAQHGQAALDLLASLPPRVAYARACGNLAQLRLRTDDRPAALRWGQQAIDLAVAFGDPPTHAQALITVGTARLRHGEEGRRQIEQGLAIARDCGLHDDVARALTTLASEALGHHQLAAAERAVSEGLAFTVEHDLIAQELALRALQAQLWLIQGRWPEAAAEAHAVTVHPRATVPTRIGALTVLGQVRARTGDDPSSALDEALRLAAPTGELRHLGPLRAARAEAAWLAGDPALAAAEAAHEFARAVGAGESWLAGRLALWRHRGGHRIADPAPLATPYAREIAGDGAAAARCWHDLGGPLEEARALAAAGDELALRQALAILARLGAAPDAARVVRALRRAGATAIPRGPRPTTRANPAQLTARELEVLARLVCAQSNREIAAALYLSPRTVGHHVSAILAKLQIASRAEARARAAELGLLPAELGLRQDGSSAAPS